MTRSLLVGMAIAGLVIGCCERPAAAHAGSIGGTDSRRHHARSGHDGPSDADGRADSRANRGADSRANRGAHTRADGRADAGAHGRADGEVTAPPADEGDLSCSTRWTTSQRLGDRRERQLSVAYVDGSSPLRTSVTLASRSGRPRSDAEYGRCSVAGVFRPLPAAALSASSAGTTGRLYGVALTASGGTIFFSIIETT